MLLSIGMIVKNEEKHLERCLKALQPLNNRIDYEIVIVDTGSTDRTKEIAYKYTDKVYDFEWINDFAAARNYGLNKCTGKWFLFLDADEEIDDCEPLIEFLTNPANDKYNTVSFRFKLFTGKDTTNYIYSILARMFKNNNIQFIGKIHEAILINDPLYVMRGNINHYGYIGDIGKKFDRNDKIIDEVLKSDPYNSNCLYQKINSLKHRKKYSEIFELYDKYIATNSRSNINEIANCYRIDDMLIQIYLAIGKYEEAQRHLEFVKKTYSKYEMLMISFYDSFILYWRNKQTEDLYCDKNIEKYILDYLHLYKKYNENKYDGFEMTIFSVDVNEKKYSNALYVLAQYYYNKKDYKKMYINFNKLYFKESSSIPCDLEFKVMKELRNYDRIMEIYEYCKELELVNEFFEKVQGTREDNDFYQELVKVFGSNANDLDSPYKEYYQFMVDKTNNTFITAISEFNEMPECLSDTIYYLMKNNIYIDDFKWVSNPRKHEKHAFSLMTYHYDVCQVVLKYIREVEEIPHRRILGFYVSLLYFVLVTDQELSDEDYKYLLEIFIFWQMEVAKGLYKENLFTANEIDFLPERIQYCYYMDKAIKLINESSYKEALNTIKLAMKQDEKLVKGCKLLLRQIEEKQEETKPMSEFEQYARKVKDAIIGLINAGKMNEATTLYKQYKLVNPKDNELDVYFNKLI